MMHTSAMVRLMDQLALNVRFTNASQEPFVGQEHAPTETSRPLSTGPNPCVVCNFSEPPVLCCASHWLWGPRVLGHTYIPLSVCDGLHVFLVLGQYFRIVVIVRLQNLSHHRHWPTVRIVRTTVPINSCTSAKPHRHKQRPITHHHGRGPCKVQFSFGVKSPCTSLKRLPVAQPPLGSPHLSRCLTLQT